MTDSGYPSTEEVWRLFGDRLRNFARTRLSCDADADDVVQQVFLRVHEKLDSLRDTERIESWLFQVTRNAIVDHLRKSGSQPDALIDDRDQLSTEEVRADNLNEIVAAWIRSALDRLPPDQRRAVELYELDGVSQKEIARRENISLSGMKSRIQRGRERLATFVRDCCDFQLDRRGNVLGCSPKDEQRGNSPCSNANCRCD